MNDRINSVKLGITLGLIFGLSFFLLALVSNTYGSGFFNVLKSVYPGCGTKTIWNKLTCGFLGGLDGLFFGLLIGVIYNNIPL